MCYEILNVCRYAFRQRYSFAQAAVLELRLPVTVAKFINNCSLLLLLHNRVTPDETMAEICITADC